MDNIVGVVRLNLDETFTTRRGDLQYTLDDIMEGTMPLQTDLTLFYDSEAPGKPLPGVKYEVILRELGS